MILRVLFSFTDILAIVILTGGIVSGIYIVQRGMVDLTYRSLLNNIKNICTFVLLFLMLENMLNLIFVTMNMSQSGFLSSFNFITIVLFKTHFGTIWIIKLSSIILFALILSISKNIFENKNVLILTAFLLLVICFGRSAVSHSADSGDFTIPELSDYIHLLAASAWGGGLIIFSFLIIPKFKSLLPNEKRQIAFISRRLSITATVSLILIVITAAFNAWYEIGSFGSFVLTAYGRTALLKLICLILIASLGMLNHYLSIPVLEDTAEIKSRKSFLGMMLLPLLKPNGKTTFESEINKLSKRIKYEVVFIIIVLMLTSVLVNQKPGKDFKKNTSQNIPVERMTKKYSVNNTYLS